MNHRPTPSEAFTTGVGDPAPAPDEPVTSGRHPEGRHGNADTEMHRLDNRALIIVGIAVLLLLVAPYGPLPPRFTEVPEALPIAQHLIIGLTLLCQATAAVLAWQALRVDPIIAEDAETAAAHARDAVHDKREGTTRAAGILVAAVVLAIVSLGVAFAAARFLPPASPVNVSPTAPMEPTDPMEPMERMEPPL